MGILLPTSEDVNKVLFLPAFAFLAIDLVNVNLVVTPLKLAVIYTVFSGIYHEFAQHYDKSLLEELSNFWFTEDKSSTANISVALTILLIIGHLSALILLITNVGSLKTSQPTIYLLYTSLLIANTFFVSRMFGVGLIALVEINFSEAVEMGSINYLKKRPIESLELRKLPPVTGYKLYPDSIDTDET